MNVSEIVLIGANGLVGSAFRRYFDHLGQPYKVIQRENASSHGITSCDLLINCAGGANKRKANSDTGWDLKQSVLNILPYFIGIQAKKIVHISSVDVYPKTAHKNDTKEELSGQLDGHHTYGFHKLFVENYVRQFCSDYLILRLPALVGPGLTKNPIFDFFDPEKLLLISPKSRLNVVHVDDVASMAMDLVKMKVVNETFNLAAVDMLKLEGLKTHFKIEYSCADGAIDNIQNYDINVSKISKIMPMKNSLDSVIKYYNDISCVKKNV